MADRYPLTRDVEALVALAAVSQPRFWEMIGHAIDPEKMPREPARHLLMAAREMAKVAPCAQPSFAVQHLRALVNRGQLTMAQLEAASDLVDLAEDLGGVKDVEGLVQAIAPAVRRVEHKAVVSRAMESFGKGDDPDEVAEEFANVAALGTKRVSLGTAGDFSAQDLLAAATSTMRDPIATGITELDVALGGGLEKGALHMVLANSGDGKSLFLSHVAAEQVFSGMDVAIISLELPEADIKQRVYCNVLGMTRLELAADVAEAQRRYRALQARPEGVGQWRVVRMSPKVATVADIKSWLRDVKRDGFDPQLLVVDYADRLGGRGAKGQQTPTHEEMRIVYEALDSLAVERDGYLLTASQARGREGRKKKVDLEDVADSMHKIRASSTVIAITRSEDDVRDGMIRFSLPKRRNNQAHANVGPVPMDAERWRIVATSRPEPW